MITKLGRFEILQLQETGAGFNPARGRIKLTVPVPLPPGFPQITIPRGARLATPGGHHVATDETAVLTDANPERTVGAVALLARTVGGRLGVKASGGIRTLADVEVMLGAGATRLGMSATMAVVSELSAG